MKKDSLDPKSITTTRYEISADELEARMERKRQIHDEPIMKGVEILMAAMDTVLKSLAVDVDQDSELVKAQQEAMGITIWEHTDSQYPQLNGFYVHVGYDLFIPYAWVGDAYLNAEGKCFCQVHWFQKERLTEVGGAKIL